MIERDHELCEVFVLREEEEKRYMTPNTYLIHNNMMNQSSQQDEVPGRTHVSSEGF